EMLMACWFWGPKTRAASPATWAPISLRPSGGSRLASYSGYPISSCPTRPDSAVSRYGHATVSHGRMAGTARWPEAVFPTYACGLSTRSSAVVLHHRHPTPGTGGGRPCATGGGASARSGTSPAQSGSHAVGVARFLRVVGAPRGPGRQSRGKREGAQGRTLAAKSALCRPGAVAAGPQRTASAHQRHRVARPSHVRG